MIYALKKFAMCKQIESTWLHSTNNSTYTIIGKAAFPRRRSYIQARLLILVSIESQNMTKTQLGLINKSRELLLKQLKSNSSQVLTLVDNWLDKLMTCSRASVNSRFSLRTSFAWRCSSVVDPYIDDPPDMSEIWLPCAVGERNGNWFWFILMTSMFTVVILLLIDEPMIRVCWWKKPSETTRGWGCWLTPRHCSTNRQTIVRLSLNVWPTTQHWRIHFFGFRWSAKQFKRNLFEKVKAQNNAREAELFAVGFPNHNSKQNIFKHSTGCFSCWDE